MADNIVAKNALGVNTTLRTKETGGVHTPVHKAQLQVADADVSVGNPVPTSSVALGAAADAEASGDGSVIALLKRLRTLLGGVLSFIRPPLTYTQVVGSPFTLTSSWVKVATTTASTKGLRLSSIASATTYDIEWVSVTAGASAPTDTYGEPVLAGEDFAAGLPIGDIYLKSASGQIAIVKTGA